MGPSVSKLSKVAETVFGRTYELTLVKTYVSRWGPVQAIRELIQNALDSKSPFVYEWQVGDNRWNLRLTSEFSTLTPQTLLLGATSKAEDENAIGSFGEGYKIALLVLVREGFEVEMLNGDVIWSPTFRYSSTFQEDLLTIVEHFNPHKNKGLSVIVRGLSSQLKDEVVESCLMMQENIGQIKSTQYGDILLDKPGRLYVGHLYICETELKYGYNVKPAFIQLERDRQTVSSYDLKSTTLKMWYDTKETERVAEMIKAQVPDVEYAQYDAPEIIKEECYRIFKRDNPGALIASSPEEMKRMVEQGLTKTVYVGGGGYYHAVSSSRSYRAERPKVIEKISPHVALQAWFSAYQGEMRTKAIVSFKQILNESKNWMVK